MSTLGEIPFWPMKTTLKPIPIFATLLVLFLLTYLITMLAFGKWWKQREAKRVWAVQVIIDGKPLFIDQFLAPILDMQETDNAKEKLFLQLLDIESLQPYNSFHQPTDVYKLHPIVEFSKKMKEKADHLRQDGKLNQAIELHAACYRIGQLLNADGSPGQRFIGITMRQMAIRALFDDLIFLSKIPNKNTNLEQILRKLNNLSGQETGHTLLDGDTDPAIKRFMGRSNPADQYQKLIIMQKYADIQYRLLCIEAANQRLGDQIDNLAHNEKPKLLALDKELPDDVFGGKVQIQPAMEKGKAQKYYSIGPDEIDNKAEIQYDPTNGTISPGDIWLIEGPEI